MGYLGSQRPCSKPHRNGLVLPRSTFHGQLPEWVGPTGSDHPIGAGPIQYPSSFVKRLSRWFSIGSLVEEGCQVPEAVRIPLIAMGEPTDADL